MVDPVILIKAASFVVDLLSKIDFNDLINISKAIENLPVERVKQKWYDRIKEVQDFYNSGNLVLVLGAGISVEHGLPDWNTLLQSMLIEVLKKTEKSSKGKPLSEDDATQIASLHSTIFYPNPLVSARFLRATYKDELLFLENIQRSLYAHHEIKYESKVFAEIAQLCAAPGKMPSLDAVLNFNFDDILERYLKKLDIRIQFTPVYAPGFVDNNRLAIYHPHGYLPHEGSLDPKIRVVLSEQDYHEQYKSIYDWSNIIQINKYSEKNCLFIGTSLSDPNLRRLLDIGRALRGTDSICHFIVRKKYKLLDIKESLSQITKSTISEGSGNDENVIDRQLDQLADGIAALQETMDERDASSFGIGTLWVDEWDEIPDILRSLPSDFAA